MLVRQSAGAGAVPDADMESSDSSLDLQYQMDRN